MLTMTEKAADKVRTFAEQMPEAKGKDLRIFIQGGGCSGFQYGFTFDDLQDGDMVVESSGVRVLVDQMSAQYLSGATVDFIEDLRGAGFVVENPNAVRSCGCGHSFAVEWSADGGWMSSRPLDGRHRAIIRLGHPALRQHALSVPPERFGTRFLRDLGRDLMRTMFEDSGVGLAAPQIAVGVRAFAYYVPGEGDHDEVPPRVLVNPALTLLGEPTEIGWEGCLSIPGLRGLVPRHPAIRVEAVDPDGTPLLFEATGFHARVIQHEYDHLDGIMFVDRMRAMGSLMFEEEWEQYVHDRELPVEV